MSVIDNGRGIEPKCLETVFDRFYQEEGALRRSAGGTGLGLAICRQIVTGWGGSIWAESLGKDQGCQFSFAVPIFEAPQRSKGTPESAPTPKPPARRKSTRPKTKK